MGVGESEPMDDTMRSASAISLYDFRFKQINQMHPAFRVMLEQK